MLEHVTAFGWCIYCERELDQLEIEISVIYKGEKINVDISDEALESIQEDIELTYNEEHKESEEE